MTAPVEVKIPAAVIALGAVAFLAVDLVMSSDSLRLSVGASILAVAVCVGLLARLRFVRFVTMIVVFVLAVLHLLIALGDAPVWVRLVSGVLTAAYIYSAVLVNTEPARQYLESK